MELYNNWDVSGEPREITLADGSKRMSWPLTWEQMEQYLKNLHVKDGVALEGALTETDIAAIKTETVDNADKPWLDEQTITWPAIQNVFRDAWILAYQKEWKPEEHAVGMDYHCLLRMNTLQVKVDGLTKMVHEKGHEDCIAGIWQIFAAWPNPMGEEQEVMRINRKDGSPQMKKTWPLPWTTDGEGPSVVKVLEECGWGEFLIAAIKTQLFDKKDQSGVHANCNEETVVWPDIQQAFRSAVTEEPWSELLSMEWEPLAPEVTLRLKIEKTKLKEVLEGEWRMYCKPEDGGEAFSYGLLTQEVVVDPETGNGSFSGRSRVEGKYVVEEGIIEWNPINGRTKISYCEVWPNGQRDALTARVKSNGKFLCESESGYYQKATREDLNLPPDAEDRIGEEAPAGIKKYFLYDNDAAIED